MFFKGLEFLYNILKHLIKEQSMPYKKKKKKTKKKKTKKKKHGNTNRKQRSNY